MGAVKSIPVATTLGERLTLEELRNFVEAAALYPPETTLRVKLVPFKEMGNVDGQPVRRITLDTP